MMYPSQEVIERNRAERERKIKAMNPRQRAEYLGWRAREERRVGEPASARAIEHEIADIEFGSIPFEPIKGDGSLDDEA